MWELIPLLMDAIGPEATAAGGGEAAAAGKGGAEALGSAKNLFKSAFPSPGEIKPGDQVAAEHQAEQQQIAGERDAAQAALDASQAVKDFAKQIGIGGGAVAGVVTAMVGFSAAVVAGNEYLKEYNGQIAASYAMLQQQDISLNRQLGDATSGTASGAVDQWASLKQEFEPVREMISTLTNSVAIIATAILRLLLLAVKVASPLLFALEKLSDFIEWFMGKEENKKDNLSALADFAFQDEPTMKRRGGK